MNVSESVNPFDPVTHLVVSVSYRKVPSVPDSSISKPCMLVASPAALPTKTLNGMTSGTLALRVRAASRISSQVFGCQSAGSPAWAKIFLLK